MPKTVVDIPAGAFYVADTKNKDVLVRSDGAFGCCYVTAEDKASGKTLIAHVNAQSAMMKPVADETARRMLSEFEKQGGSVANAKFTIVHSDKFEDYERAQSEKTIKHQLTNSYKEKTPENMVVEPYANGFIKGALERAGVSNIEVNSEFNSNLKDFIKDPINNKPEKTDICFANGQIYLQNFQNGKATKGAENAFKQFNRTAEGAQEVSCGDWKTVANHYLALREGLDSGQISSGKGGFDFTQEATPDFKEKMNPQNFAAINMNPIVEQSISEFKDKKSQITHNLR